MKILIVEDEMIIGADISMHLERMGHDVIGLLPSAEDVLPFIENHKPELILLDIQLKGEKDGIEVALEIKAKHDIPIIFLTANADDHHFERAKVSRPEAFISKPFTSTDLERAIELTARRYSEKEPESSTDISILDDRIFVFDKGERVRVFVKDFYYLEADRNYSKISTVDREFLLSLNLKALEQNLPESFLRVHRSYIVNLHAIESIHDTHIMIKGKVIPISKSMRSSLMERLRVL